MQRGNLLEGYEVPQGPDWGRGKKNKGLQQLSVCVRGGVRWRSASFLVGTDQIYSPKHSSHPKRKLNCIQLFLCFFYIILLKIKMLAREHMWPQLMSCAHLLVRDGQSDSLTFASLCVEMGEGSPQNDLR